VRRREDADEAALTRAQRALLDAEPDLPERAARAAVRSYGEARFCHLSWEERIAIAALGVLEATRRYDPSRGQTYRDWAFFAGVNRLLDAGREERAAYAKARALVRAAALSHFAEAQPRVEIGVDTTESLAAKLAAFSDPLVGHALMALAVAPLSEGGEEELVEREAAARAAEALRAALPPPGTEERRMLELHFVKRAPLTEVAASLGVPEPGYRTFVRRFQEVLAALRRRLREGGIDELPPWREDVGGAPLGPESGR
jgi:DNA-directed RNA polymerase specialized sigma subunit